MLKKELMKVLNRMIPNDSVVLSLEADRRANEHEHDRSIGFKYYKQQDEYIIAIRIKKGESK